MQYSDFDWYQRQRDAIAQGCLTNSKHPRSHVLGVYPTHIVKADDCVVECTNGKKYIDYICGLGVNLVGYQNDRVKAAAKNAIDHGTSHSLSTVYEVETAEQLKQIFYFVDKFKFLKSGSEACSAAVKIARAYTGRERVISLAYHGWHDDFISLTKPALGVPKRTWMQAYEEGILDVDLKDTAAIIVEPVIDEWDTKRLEWLQRLRMVCDHFGVVLIFDEVITGYRFSGHSVTKASSVIPDLIILGKAMANGLPLAAVGGKAKIMDCDYFVSSTYAGDIVSLAAARAVCQVLTTNPRYRIENLWEAGERFIERFNEYSEITGVRLRAYPTRGTFVGDSLAVALFRQEAAKAGYLLHTTWFYNFPLMKYDDQFFDFLHVYSEKYRRGEAKLEGAMPYSPFAQKVREGA
jgi:glutamate-1-semialdehyde 2,1-aminomutase